MSFCDSCQIEKPESEFYILRNRKPARFCKICFQKRQKTYTKKGKYNTGIISQDTVMAYIRSQGIYIMPGRDNNKKTEGFAYCDAVAWGCIRVEIKKTIYDKGHRGFVISFTDDQIEYGIKGDFIVVVDILLSGNKYYVLPVNFPYLYRNGVLKHRVSFTEDSNRDDGRYDMLKEYEDAWYLIEDKRIQISESLLK